MEEKALFNIGLVGRREYLRAITVVALCTGMRKGELLRLKRDDLNFGSVSLTRVIKGEIWEILPGWLLIEKTKKGKPRAIPMSQRVAAILKRLCEDELLANISSPATRLARDSLTLRKRSRAHAEKLRSPISRSMI